jgi:hypothetical protein
VSSLVENTMRTNTKEKKRSLVMEEHVVTEIGSNKPFYKVSCKNCRNSHRKCDRELPSCSQCTRKGIECCYVPPKKRRRGDDDTTTMTTTTTLSQSYTVATTQQQQQLNLLRHIGLTMEDKMNSAAMYAMRALFFLHVPIVKSHPQHLRHMCDDMDRQLSKVAPSLDTSDLYDLTQSMSKVQIQQNAVNMFNKGKELVLHPDIFPNIATNAPLALACSLLAAYQLTSRKQNIPEAMLFNSAVKVFVKETKAVADSEQLPTLMNTDNHSAMIQYRESVQTVSAAFYTVKLLHFFHSDIFRYTMNDLADTFQLLMKISKYVMSVFPAEQTRHHKSLQIFTSISQIIKEYSGLRRIEQILHGLESIVDEITTAQEVAVTMIRGLQLYSLSIELKTVTDIHEYLEMKALQLKHSNLITMIVTENSIITEFIANGSRLLVHVCEVHIEHCDKILSDPNTNSVELSEALTFLQSDVIFMDRLQKNEPLPIYDEILLKLHSRVVSLLTGMQQFYRLKQEQPRESILSQLLYADKAPDAPDETAAIVEILPPQDFQLEQLDIDNFFNF